MLLSAGGTASAGTFDAAFRDGCLGTWPEFAGAADVLIRAGFFQSNMADGKIFFGNGWLGVTLYEATQGDAGIIGCHVATEEVSARGTFAAVRDGSEVVLGPPSRGGCVPVITDEHLSCQMVWSGQEDCSHLTFIAFSTSIASATLVHMPGAGCKAEAGYE